MRESVRQHGPERSMNITRHIDLATQGRTAVAEALARLLGDTYALQVKTQGYHWNVTGPHFHSLHALFEEQYEALAEAADELAERIRALGHRAPGGLQALLKLSSIPDESGTPAWQDMIKALGAGHDAAAATARAVITVAEEARDDASVDLAVERIQAHEKAAWMLRATIS